jgi:hypothetical protein
MLRLHFANSAFGGETMLHILIAVALVAHGVGHTVGFWMKVPLWFELFWMLAGAGFVAGAWGFWQRTDWWPTAIALSAAGSLIVMMLPHGVFDVTPFSAALAFNLVTLFVLIVPTSRQWLSAA